MQRVSAEGGSNVYAPAVSKSIAQRDINQHISTNITNVHHHYGVWPSSPAQQSQDHDKTIAEYKTSVQSSYEKLKEYNSRSGENMLLSERYTDLLMVECHRKPEEREEEICSRGERLQKVLKRRAYSKITIEHLFRPDNHGCVPKAVILQGHSGYGKSFTAQKIMLDWASGILYKDMLHLVLNLQCKEINEITGECSLVDLLNYSPNFTSDTEDVLRDPNIKVLFVVDGFDELTFSLEDASSALPKDPFTKAPVQATLKALLKGHILPKCLLLLTTRSTATDKLSHLVTDSQRFVDILGFTDEGVEHYFHRFFNDKLMEETVFETVRNNETLYTACFIPVICWIVCTVFREQVQKGAQIIMDLETPTSIFAYFVLTLLKHHGRDLTQPVPDLLSSLGRLAEKGLQEQRVMFEKKDVLSMVSDPEGGPFLCKFFLKKKVGLEEMFSFMHQSFQEFFAALHYTLDQDGEKLKRLLNYRVLGRKKYEEGWKSHYQPVIQFLFGLANKKVMQDLGLTSSIRCHLEKWIMEVTEPLKELGGCGSLLWDIREGNSLFILHCLNELHEDEFVRTIMDNVGPLSFLYHPLTKVDCWVLRYCLLCCTTIKKLELDLNAETLTMLAPALSRCKELRLQRKDIKAVSYVSLTLYGPFGTAARNEDDRMESEDSEAEDTAIFREDFGPLHLQNFLKAISAVKFNDTDADYSLKEFFSPLIHVPGLKKVNIRLKKRLNRSWRFDIISLVNHHPSLQRLKLAVDFIDDCVMDDSPMDMNRTDCTVIIKGRRRGAFRPSERAWKEEVIVETRLGMELKRFDKPVTFIFGKPLDDDHSLLDDDDWLYYCCNEKLPMCCAVM